MGGGDDCPTLRKVLAPLNCLLPNGSDGKFYVCVFYHNKSHNNTVNKQASEIARPPAGEG